MKPPPMKIVKEWLRVTARRDNPLGFCLPKERVILDKMIDQEDIHAIEWFVDSKRTTWSQVIYLAALRGSLPVVAGALEIAPTSELCRRRIEISISEAALYGHPESSDLLASLYAARKPEEAEAIHTYARRSKGYAASQSLRKNRRKDKSAKLLYRLRNTRHP